MPTPLRIWAALAFAGCGTEPTADIISVDGLVQGTVRMTNGTPVPDAWLALEGSYPLGNGNTVPLYDSVRTDTDGYYLGRVGVLNLPDTVAPLSVRVWPPTASGLVPAVATDLTVRVTASLSPADTLVVDVTLSPS